MPVSISGDGAITGLELEAFEDVDVGSGASDGDVLTYDASGDLWIPQGIVPISGIGSNVVQTVKTDTFSTASSSFVDITGVSVTITPSSATSKVLVTVSGQTANNNSSFSNLMNLRRNSTNIAQSTGGTDNQTYTAFTASTASGVGFQITFLDSPNTTSATTYSMQIKTNGGTAFIGRYASSGTQPSITTITAIEVAA
jgi:hypothetical protein